MQENNRNFFRKDKTMQAQFLITRQDIDPMTGDIADQIFGLGVLSQAQEETLSNLDIPPQFVVYRVTLHDEGHPTAVVEFVGAIHEVCEKYGELPNRMDKIC